MCGLAGFAGAGDIDTLRRMTDALRHRGPDDEGLWKNDAALFLGFRRLAIIDLAGGHQPMFTADGKFGVVFNGEIYNHAELRAALKKRGHVFQTDHSDTEVLLHGYREWGSELPRRLNGMWAFALFDRKNTRLFCSRDRFGKKPFFYSAGPGHFIFGSELTALLQHPRVRPNVSRRALQKYFAYGYIPAPLSLYENVFKLAGGCSLELDTRTFTYRTDRYWDLVLEPFDCLPANPEEEWGEQIRDLLDRAVQRRWIPDVPLG